MVLHVPSASEIDIETLVNRITDARATYIDNIDNSQLLNIPNLSTLTPTLIGYLNNINNPNLATIGDISSLTAALIGYLNNINNPHLLNVPNIKIMEHELEFPSADVLDVIAATGDQTTTERTITVSVPTGATIQRAMLLAVITAMNDSATAQKIDVTVQGRKGSGSWSSYFSETDCMGFGATDGATTSIVPVQNVTALVDAATSYGFRLTVNQSAANSVRYTTQYLLVVTYRMS